MKQVLLRVRQLRLTGIALSIHALAGSAWGQDRDITRCRSISSDLQRLACYDSLAASPKSAAPAVDSGTTLPGFGKWRLNETTDPIDDSRAVTIRLAADSATRGEAALNNLVARCVKGETELFILWEEYIGSATRSSGVPLTYRIGDAPPKTEAWNASSSGRATFHDGTSKPVFKNPSTTAEFIKQIAAGTGRFVVRVQPYQQSFVSLVFDTRGLENAMQPLKERCNWLEKPVKK